LSIKSLLLIFISVLLSASGQCFLKMGAVRQSPIINIRLCPSFILALLNPYVMIGLVLYLLSALFWIKALGLVDLSLAYPFIAVGIIITMVFSAFFLGEKITAMRIAGTLVIALGLVLVARS